MWKYTGRSRPDFADEPSDGQESVWDYPRPPRLKRSSRHVEIRAGDTLIARSSHCVRVLETASPPTWYVPPGDVDWRQLVAADGSSFCEWKGSACYWGLATDAGSAVAWTYPGPSAAFAEIKGFLSAFPGRVECYVDDERVRPQPGRFYGGWITSDVAGPFKGEPSTGHW